MAVTKDMIQKGILMTVSYAFLMSISTVGAKQAQTIISVPALLFWQSFMCCLILLPQLRESWKPLPASVWRVLFYRSFSGFAALLCYYLALNHIPIVDASLLRTCAPLCVPFVVLVFYRKAIPSARWLPLLMGFVGAALVIRPTPTNISVWHIVAFASAVGLAVSMVTTRMLSSHISYREALFSYFGFSALLSLMLVWYLDQSLVLPRESWLWVILVSASLYVGMYLYTLAYTYAPASIVSPVSYIGVVFNGVWGWFIWDHLPDPYAWLGTVFIFISIILSARVKVR